MRSEEQQRLRDRVSFHRVEGGKKNNRVNVWQKKAIGYKKPYQNRSEKSFASVEVKGNTALIHYSSYIHADVY